MVNEEWVGTSETDPILVDFLPHDVVRTPGRLGMTFAPGMWAGSVKGRWERDLAADLRELEEEYGANVLVSLMEDHEYRGYRIRELLERDRFGGIEVLRFAIEDMSVPREAESERFEAFVQDVVRRLEQGQNVVVHCRGGFGRTGTVAACVLVALGRSQIWDSFGWCHAGRLQASRRRCRIEVRGTVVVQNREYVGFHCKTSLGSMFSCERRGSSDGRSKK